MYAVKVRESFSCLVMMLYIQTSSSEIKDISSCKGKYLTLQYLIIWQIGWVVEQQYDWKRKTLTFTNKNPKELKNFTFGKNQKGEIS